MLFNIMDGEDETHLLIPNRMVTANGEVAQFMLTENKEKERFEIGFYIKAESQRAYMWMYGKEVSELINRFSKKVNEVRKSSAGIFMFS